jgi:hypothetical protein
VSERKPHINFPDPHPLVAIRKTPGKDRFFREFLFQSLAWYLVFWQLVLYLIQGFIATPRQDPFNPGSIYYGFPSQPGFYVAVVVTFVFTYTFAWNVTPSHVEWAGIYIFLLAPGVLLGE